MARTIDWFEKRVGKTIQVEINDVWKPITILNEEHAAWLAKASEEGYPFIEDSDIQTGDNTCISCEG